MTASIFSCSMTTPFAPTSGESMSIAEGSDGKSIEMADLFQADEVTADFAFFDLGCSIVGDVAHWGGFVCMFWRC